jgi:hypothetical protein
MSAKSYRNDPRFRRVNFLEAQLRSNRRQIYVLRMMTLAVVVLGVFGALMFLTGLDQ